MDDAKKVSYSEYFVIKYIQWFGCPLTSGKNGTNSSSYSKWLNFRRWELRRWRRRIKWNLGVELFDGVQRLRHGLTVYALNVFTHEWSYLAALADVCKLVLWYFCDLKSEWHNFVLLKLNPNVFGCRLNSSVSMQEK